MEIAACLNCSAHNRNKPLTPNYAKAGRLLCEVAMSLPLYFCGPAMPAKVRGQNSCQPPL